MGTFALTVVIYGQVVSADSDSDSDSDPAPDSSKKRAQPPAWNNPLSWDWNPGHPLCLVDFASLLRRQEETQLSWSEKTQGSFFPLFVVYKPQLLFFCRGPFALPGVILYAAFVLRGAGL